MTRLLDLFCCQGGASAGYALAGFKVTGVDLADQPRYPFDFIQGDALAYLDENADYIKATYSAIAGSPPCQGHSKTQQLWHRDWPDLIDPFRQRLIKIGLPYVIENVVGAPLNNPVTLCGAMFGLRTYRHRLFETGGGFVLTQPDEPEHLWKLTKMGRKPVDGQFIHAVGNFSGVKIVKKDWGVEWMDRDGIRESIPPAYTRFIGTQLMQYLVSCS